MYGEFYGERRVSYQRLPARSPWFHAESEFIPTSRVAISNHTIVPSGGGPGDTTPEADMGRIIPADFPMEQLANNAERTVVSSFITGLYSNWLIIPGVGMRDHEGQHETDIVLIHPDMGVVLVEVKGHRIAIREGIWYGQEGTPLNPQPIKQALDNAKSLERLIRKNVEGLERLEVVFGLAFPNTREIKGDLTPDITPAQVLVAGDLLDPDDPIERMAHSRTVWNRALTAEQIEAIVKIIRPDAEFRWDAEARTTATRQALDQLRDAQITSMVSLAQNRRVLVRGGAGTGKTHLGVLWARQAWVENDRVLLTCYNDPLAEFLIDAIGFEPDEALTIGPFIRTVLAMPGMPELVIPPTADQHWWETEALGHLVRNWPQIGARFDTIIVDEAQDFSPAWIALLQALLDPDGRRRVLLLADEGQGIYERGFVFPEADDGWVQVELASNFRNARPIARLLRNHLGGAPAPVQSPEGLGVTWIEAADAEAVEDAVDGELQRIIENEGRSPAGVCVGTIRSSVRDHLRAALHLVRWEDRHDGQVVCENVHRLKGLEFDTMILAATADCEDEALLYVGVSRAVSELIVVAPRELADRLGLVRA